MITTYVDLCPHQPVQCPLTWPIPLQWANLHFLYHVHTIAVEDIIMHNLCILYISLCKWSYVHGMHWRRVYSTYWISPDYTPGLKCCVLYWPDFPPYSWIKSWRVICSSSEIWQPQGMHLSFVSLELFHAHELVVSASWYENWHDILHLLHATCKILTCIAFSHSYPSPFWSNHSR